MTAALCAPEPAKERPGGLRPARRRRDRGAAAGFWLRLSRLAELESAAFLAALGVLCLAASARKAGLFGLTSEEASSAWRTATVADGEALDSFDPGEWARRPSAARAPTGAAWTSSWASDGPASGWRAGAAGAVDAVSLPGPRMTLSAGGLRLWNRPPAVAATPATLFARRAPALSSDPAPREALTPVIIGPELRRPASTGAGGASARALGGDAGSWERLRADGDAQTDDLTAATAAAAGLASAARHRLADGRAGSPATAASAEDLKGAARQESDSWNRDPLGVRFSLSARRSDSEGAEARGSETGAPTDGSAPSGDLLSAWRPGRSTSMRWGQAAADLGSEVADRFAPRSTVAAFRHYAAAAGAKPAAPPLVSGPGADCRALAALNAPPPPGAVAADPARTARGIALCKANLAVALHNVLEEGPAALPDYEACLTYCAH